MKKRYYLFTFSDAYDDAYGGSHSFINEIALSSDSYLFEHYSQNHISKTKITKEEYDEWNEVN